MESIKVFISYTHDSQEHSKQVLELSNRLRAEGFDCDIDQYHANQDWPAWMERSIESAQFVLIVCTPNYQRRWNNDEKPGVGLGAQWESLLTRQHLYLSPGSNDKFIPLLFASEHLSCIPIPLTNVTRIDLEQESNFDLLRRRLLNIAPAAMPPLRISLAPFVLADGFFGAPTLPAPTRPSAGDQCGFNKLPVGLNNETETLFPNLFPVTFAAEIQTAKVTTKRTVKFSERLQETWGELGRKGKAPEDFFIEDGILYRFEPMADELWKAMAEKRLIKLLPPKTTGDWAESRRFADKNRFIRLLNRSLDGLCSEPVMTHRIGWSKELKCHLFLAKPDVPVGKMKVKALISDASREVYKAIPNKLSADPKSIQHWQHQAFRHFFLRFGDTWYLNVIPFWAFTGDGVGGPSRWQKSSSANMRRPEKNRAVLGHVMFWASILCREPDWFREATYFQIHRPIELRTAPKIVDRTWIAMAKDEERGALTADLDISF